mgnify:CR=1 FL=1
MSSLEIVAASIALLALLVTGLSMNVSRLRIRHRVSYGDGGHKDLLVAIRAHGNAIEHVPLYAALAVAAAMLQYTSAVWLGLCAAVFVVARCVHALAIFTRRLALRQLAHVASTLVHITLAAGVGWSLWLRI